ncbi:MAG: peptidase domain-containing ABC transporter, partial [Bacteroidota bacterium]
GYVPMERLRSLSGTTTSGTTLLGLLQAGESAGMETEAFEGTIDELKKISDPTLLHIVKFETIEHYVVCYGTDGANFLIGDPEDGIKLMSSEELDLIWRTKALLIFKTKSNFVTRSKIAQQKYRWIRNIVREDYTLILIAIVIGIFISFLNFSTVIFTEKLVDNLIPSKDTSTIVAGLFAWIALMSFKAVFGYSREVLLLNQAYSLNVRLTKDFLGKLLAIPKSFFDSRKKGDLIARLYDTSRVQTTVALIISQDVIDILTLIVAVVLVFFYEATVGLFVLMLIPAFFVIVYNYYSRIYKSNRLAMSSYSRIESSYIDALTGVEVIKQHSGESTETEYLSHQFKRFQDNLVSAGRVSSKFKLTTDAFGLLAIFYVLTNGVYSVLSNTIELGDMLAVFSISSIALSSTNRIAYAITHLQEARAALDRTYDIISLDKEPSDGIAIKSIEHISFHNVSFRYPGHSQLLKDVNFSLKKGQIFALKGDNGSGKSTILQIIQKFYPAESGSVLINDLKMEEINTKSLRALIGIVPQHIKIFNQSLAYNICLNHKVDEQELLNFCDEHQLTDFIFSFRDGLGTILGEEGVNASGGQRQLIALARALYKKPEFLLLDEFTSSMDEETEKLAIEIVRKFKTRAVVLIIT